MISKNSAESQAAPLPAAQAGAAGTPLMSAQAPIEVAPPGNVNVNDPSGISDPPSGVEDLDPRQY